jgi:hypothetical protein
VRDDIHKKVPRPAAVQTWIRRSINDADRLNDRSLQALNDAIIDTWKREISPSFLRGLQKEITGLFRTLDNVESPRDVGGRGGHWEYEILSETKRFVAAGQPLRIPTKPPG